MTETFQGPRGRVLVVPPELRDSWAAAKPKPSRSERERDVLRYWMERMSAETIQLHILLTACVKRVADEEGGISFSIAELTALQDVKKLVSISSKNAIGEVRVTLPKVETPLIVTPDAETTKRFGAARV